MTVVVMILAVSACGTFAVGYGVGRATAPTEQEVARERSTVHRTAAVSAERRAYNEARARAYAEARQAGRTAGRERGDRAGGRQARAEVGRRKQAEARRKARAQAEAKTSEDYLGELGCDPTFIFPDGTNGCTHNYGD